MKKYEWIISDLDGTLLDHKKDKNIIYSEVVNDIKEATKNKHFTIATGRHYKDALYILKNANIYLKNDAFIVGINGAQIYSLKESKLILDKRMDDSVAKEVLKKITNFFDEYYKNEYIIGAYEKENSIFFIKNENENFDKITKSFIEYRKNENIFEYKVIENLKNIEKINKIFIWFHSIKFEKPLEITKKLKNISNKVDFVHAGPNLFEVTIKGITKATALEYINNNFYNVEIDNIIVFGDSGNDLEMFKFANTSVTRTCTGKEIITNATHVFDGGASKFISEAIKKLNLKN